MFFLIVLLLTFVECADFIDRIGGCGYIHTSEKKVVAAIFLVITGGVERQVHGRNHKRLLSGNSIL